MNATARRGKGKGKKSHPATTASKVTTVVVAALHKGPPPLTSAAGRFYAPRNRPAPLPEHDLIRFHWSNLAASVLREATSGLPVSFKVFINDNDAVSLTVIDTSVPAASYSSFFDALTHKLNQSFLVGNNPWLHSSAKCKSRTTVLLVHNAAPSCSGSSWSTLMHLGPRFPEYSYMKWTKLDQGGPEVDQGHGQDHGAE